VSIGRAWFRWFVVGASPQRSGFGFQPPLSDRFMENEVALREDFLPALLLSPLSIIRPMLHVHRHILTLFLSEGQAGKAWGPANKAMHIRKWESSGWKNF